MKAFIINLEPEHLNSDSDYESEPMVNNSRENQNVNHI